METIKTLFESISKKYQISYAKSISCYGCYVLGTNGHTLLRYDSEKNLLMSVRYTNGNSTIKVSSTQIDLNDPKSIETIEQNIKTYLKIFRKPSRIA